MVQNNKEYLNRSGHNKPENQNPDTQKFHEAQKAAINEAKKLEHELARTFEAREHH